MGTDLGWKVKLLTLFGGVARGMKDPRHYKRDLTNLIGLFILFWLKASYKTKEQVIFMIR